MSCGFDVAVPSPGWDIPAGLFVSPGIGLFILGCPISTCLNYHPFKKKQKGAQEYSASPAELFEIRGRKLSYLRK